LGNPNLEAEKVNELEFGVEGTFLDNLLSVDGASVSNKGIEAGVTIKPFRGAFGWTSTFNFTRNVNTVESIIDGVDQIIIAGFNGLGNYAVPGRPYGAINGTAFVKDANGNNVVNSLGEYDEEGEPSEIGDPNPNYTLNVINTLTYKDLAFNVQLAYQDGGDAGDAFFSGYGAADEGAIFDATNIRIREISLSYILPKSLYKSAGIGDISLKVYGNNIWYKAVNFPEGLNFDPEVLSLGVGNGRGFDLLTGPTAKRFGAALNVKF